MKVAEYCGSRNNLFLYAVRGREFDLSRALQRPQSRPRNEISYGGANGVCLLGIHARDSVSQPMKDESNPSMYN